MGPSLQPEEFLAAVIARAEEFRAHPLFWRAMRKSITATNAHYLSVSTSLRRLFKDKGSYLLGMHALFMFYGAPEQLTASSLKQAAVSHGLSSKGRASAVIGEMLRAGLLMEGAQVGRTRLISPGPALENHFRTQMTTAIAALADISDATREALPFVGDTAFFHAFLRLEATISEAVFRAFGDGPPELHLFTQRDGGMQIMVDVWGACAGEPPSAPCEISVSAIARRFDVSRPHVLKLFKDAHDAGYFAWSPETRTIAITPALVEFMSQLVGGSFAIFEIVLAHTLTAWREGQISTVAAD